MKFAIVGSRSFNDYDFLTKILSYYTITQIISGGAKGADSLAKKYATDHGIDFIEFLPNWDLHGKAAGYIRNKSIVEACDELIAFWDRLSKGTKHSIDLAILSGKPYHLYWPETQDITEGIGI